MNKWIRGILYLAAGCAGIGCAALILGLTLGGRSVLDDGMWKEARYFVRGVVEDVHKQVDRYHSNHDVTKDDKREISTEWEETGTGAHYDATEDYEQEVSEELEETRTKVQDEVEFYEGDSINVLTKMASDIQSMEIDLHHGYLEIEESEDDKIRISVSGSVDDITAKCDSGTLRIKDNRTGRQSREDAYVYLEMPEQKKFETVKIQVNAGVLETECDLFADQLIVNADAGEISLSGINAKVFTSAVGAGTIDIEDAVFERVSLDCGVGTMDIEADIKGDTQISCGMGAVDVELEDDIENVNYILSCGAGSIEIGDREYSGIAKERRIENGAQATFKLECGMGHISID